MPTAVIAQRRRIADTQDNMLLALEGTTSQLVRRCEELPMMVLIVNEDALCRLLKSDLIAKVDRDTASPATR